MNQQFRQYTPTHPTLFRVDVGQGDFNSCLRSLQTFKQGDIITLLQGLTRGTKAYSSVQCGLAPDDHIELNSELLYVNHSCEPNVAFDLSSSNSEEWQVRALRDISPSDILTFFYPSTEWDMEQPFHCACAMPSCLKVIDGAKSLSLEELRTRGYVSPWILMLLMERDAKLSIGPSKRQFCANCNIGVDSGNRTKFCGCRP